MLVSATTLEPTAVGISSGLLAGTFLFIIAIELALYILIAIGLWKAASKAGIFGLWAIIPIVQWFVIAKMAGKPLWWGILFVIPFVNLVIYIVLIIEITKRFGRGTGTILGLIFLPFIFFPILGFGSAEYSRD